MLNDNFLNNKSQFVLSSCTLFHFLAVWIISCEGFGVNFAGKILGLKFVHNLKLLVY